MSKLNPHRIEQAKQKLREQLSYEELKQLPQYKDLSKEDYELLVNTVESICIILLESYIRRIKN